MQSQAKAGAVITAAGLSERMGGVDKMMARLRGEPVLARVVSIFERCNQIDQIIIVLSKSNLKSGQLLAEEKGWSKVTAICPGGERRQDSVAAGLKLLKSCEWVVIHDGARPLVTTALITQGLKAAQETGAAAAAVPVNDTIKVAGEDMFTRETPARQNLWLVQTPQVFRYDIITEAHQKIAAEVTDDTTLVERLGHRVKLYLGSYDNIKITTPGDLALAEVLWRNDDKH